MTAPVPSRLPRSTTRGEQPTDGGDAGGREVEAVALALWEFEVTGEADAAMLLRLWPKVCAKFPEGAASYRAQATAAIAALDAHRAALLAEQPGSTLRPSDRCTCRDTFLHHNDREHGGCIECPCPEFVLAEQPGGGR